MCVLTMYSFKHVHVIGSTRTKQFACLYFVWKQIKLSLQLFFNMFEVCNWNWANSAKTWFPPGLRSQSIWKVTHPNLTKNCQRIINNPGKIQLDSTKHWLRPECSCCWQLAACGQRQVHNKKPLPRSQLPWGLRYRNYQHCKKYNQNMWKTHQFRCLHGFWGLASVMTKRRYFSSFTLIPKYSRGPSAMRNDQVGYSDIRNI